MSFLSRTTIAFCQGLLLFVRDNYCFLSGITIILLPGVLLVFVRDDCIFCLSGNTTIVFFVRDNYHCFVRDNYYYFGRDSCLLCRLPCTNTPSTFRRRSVSQTIVDPHLKRDGSYNVHTEAQAAGVYVQNKDGGEFDGWCWPGSSSYVDFTNPKGKGALSGT